LEGGSGWQVAGLELSETGARGRDKGDLCALGATKPMQKGQTHGATDSKAARPRFFSAVSARNRFQFEDLDEGYDCGAGPTESQCGTLTARVKGPGMRWDSDNAEALLALAALDHSRQWATYWTLQRAA